jgi:hypothetical protein
VVAAPWRVQPEPDVALALTLRLLGHSASVQRASPQLPEQPRELRPGRGCETDRPQMLAGPVIVAAHLSHHTLARCGMA